MPRTCLRVGFTGFDMERIFARYLPPQWITARASDQHFCGKTFEFASSGLARFWSGSHAESKSEGRLLPSGSTGGDDIFNDVVRLLLAGILSARTGSPTDVLTEAPGTHDSLRAGLCCESVRTLIGDFLKKSDIILWPPVASLAGLVISEVEKALPGNAIWTQRPTFCSRCHSARVTRHNSSRGSDAGITTSRAVRCAQYVQRVYIDYVLTATF